MFLEATGPLSVDPHSIQSKPELVILNQNMNAYISSLVMCYFASYAVLPPAIFRMNPNSLAYRLVSRAMLKAGGAVRLILKAKSPLKLLWFEKFLNTICGTNVSMSDLGEAGARVYTLERLYNLREGLSGADDTLPQRLLTESIFAHLEGGVPLEPMLASYYRIRGWNAQGIPSEQTIQHLQIRT
jgi:aldehyde:ferredoxin oxidoreductase